MSTTIWWIRRDLRLSDNQALYAATTQFNQIVPVFIFDPGLLDSQYVGSKRLAFLLEGLRKMSADLNNKDSRLIVRHGKPIDQLKKLMAESGAEAIVAEEDYSPYARRRDEEIAARLPLKLVSGVSVHPPAAVHKADGKPYTVFTPFSKAWKALPQPSTVDLLPAPASISTPIGLHSDAIPAEPLLPDSVPFFAGEAEAARRLRQFVSQQNNTLPLFEYADTRDRMDLEGTSRLSPYLRFGMISARQVAVTALEAIDVAPDAQAAKSAIAWLNEVIWREFYMAILYRFPRVRQSNFQRAYDKIRWENNESNFAAWCAGRTGYPVVDAAMRQLVQSGWMHNRARMIVASFLVKHLLIDWRQGERFFMQHLIDGDPAANNGGWQWTAGTGTDAAPYFRVFNPILQSQKFDPDGDYIHRWVPELANVSVKHIHTPWKMSTQEQQQAGCVISSDYPAPIVDHQWARARVLAEYGQAKAMA